MDMQISHYIVEKSALPKALRDTARVNMMLERGEVKTVAQALLAVGISRSAYYKYKDAITPFFELKDGSSLTLYVELEDEPGSLSAFIGIFPKMGMNILTISQNIPINSVAGITLQARAADGKTDIAGFLELARSVRGVKKLDVLGGAESL